MKAEATKSSLEEIAEVSFISFFQIHNLIFFTAFIKHGRSLRVKNSKILEHNFKYQVVTNPFL